MLRHTNQPPFTPDLNKLRATMRSEDRILVLKPIEGKSTLTSIGTIDNRLFKGENKLHAILDPRTCMWTLKYEDGNLQEALKQKFTNFKTLMDYTRAYYLKRNIEITEVID